MAAAALADIVVALHLAFVIFVVAGGVLLLRWPRLAWVHVPAVAWAAIIEFAGWLCPLTPLENWLRQRGGSAGYTGDFVARYFMPVLYPEGLTREAQIVLGFGVIALNVGLYTVVFRRAQQTSRTSRS